MPEYNDHDLLIELRTDMKNVGKDIKELKDSTSARVTSLEQSKLDKDEANRLLKEAETIHVDHEKRIRRLEYTLAIATGAFLLAELYFRYLK